MDFSFDCLCPGCIGRGLIIATNASLSAWRLQAHNFTGITCPHCGCTQDLADGVSYIAQVDRAAPKISGLSPIQGQAGSTVTITGHRLNYGNLVVKFGASNATIIDRQENMVHVTVPANVVGTFDVSVQNENGMRVEGGSLGNAFTYLP